MAPWEWVVESAFVESQLSFTEGKRSLSMAPLADLMW
jgi:hypothetical protein